MCLTAVYQFTVYKVQIKCCSSKNIIYNYYLLTVLVFNFQHVVTSNRIKTAVSFNLLILVLRWYMYVICKVLSYAKKKLNVQKYCC